MSETLSRAQLSGVWLPVVTRFAEGEVDYTSYERLVDQSLALLRQRPPGFAVLTGDDAHFFTTLTHGGDGGILASAHVDAPVSRDLRAGGRQ
jgi:dihydrodipicolinate synthase/N-acetylneuraminate lyase